MTNNPRALAPSPDGSKVFVTGTAGSSTLGQQYTTVAYDASSGTQLWRKLYSGTATGDDNAHDLAASPDGSRVFVTGQSKGIGAGDDYATVTYDASTGTQLWAKRYNGPANGRDSASSVATTSDGATVIVAGPSQGVGSGYDYATVLYDAATGDQVWVRRYEGERRKGFDRAVSAASSPDGSEVFVTGESEGATSSSDYATIAYDVVTGTMLWVRRYDGPAHGPDIAASLAASPDGSKVFVAGRSQGTTSSSDYTTVAYDATTGTRLWVRRYDGPVHGPDAAASLAASPDGSSVFVTGSSRGVSGVASATVAYDAATGKRLWLSRHERGFAHAVTESPDGSQVYVSATGWRSGTPTGFDFVTIAYSATSGTKLWAQHYDGPAGRDDEPHSIAASPDGTKVFTTGHSYWNRSRYAYATVAYAA